MSRALMPAALVLALVAGAGWQASRSPRPALVGIGCEGAAGPLYAAEESDFPRCASIQPREANPPTFALVAERADGSAYVFETRASFGDCMGRARGVDQRAFPVIYCEKES